MSFIAEGVPAPPFVIKAEVSGRSLTPNSGSGALLLVFHSYQTASTVGEIIRAIRQVYPDPGQVLIAGVTDMQVVPRFLRGTAKTFIQNAYHEASKEVPPGQDPADHIIILPDWDGAVHRAYQAPPTNSHVALVLIDEAQLIAGSYFGERPAQAALALLANGRPAPHS